jgi:hypothetical protein
MGAKGHKWPPWLLPHEAGGRVCSKGDQGVPGTHTSSDARARNVVAMDAGMHATTVREGVLRKGDGG